MSYKLFRCLSPAEDAEIPSDTGASSAIPESSAGKCADASSAVADASTTATKQQRRSRTAVSAFLSLFRSSEAASPASGVAQATPQTATVPAPPGTAGRQRGSHQRPPNSRMKLKRDRCPNCRGVLPVSSGPELAPVLVIPGQARRRRREYKEDSGCIMTEPRSSARQGTSARNDHHQSNVGARPPLSQEDSGNFSIGSNSNANSLQHQPHQMDPLPTRIYGYSEFTTCVPRIPNRDAPVSNNCLPMRG